jgi:hypothetical protein
MLGARRVRRHHPKGTMRGAPDARLDPPVSTTQLLVYGFGPGAVFEGRLVGALERIESGAALRVRDALFVGAEPATGELVAVHRHGDAGVIGLLGFRLDARERRRSTERALSSPLGQLVTRIGATLEPGCAVAAILVEHAWSTALDDAVARSGGAPLHDARVDAAAIADHGDTLLAAAARLRAAAPAPAVSDRRAGAPRPPAR